MTRASPPAHFNGSRLIRFLTDLAVADVDASPQHFAERLGQLFNFSDAIVLAAAHDEAAKEETVQRADLQQDYFAKESPAIPLETTFVSKDPVSRDPASRDRVQQEFFQVRGRLVNAIAKSCTPNSDSPRIKLPVLRAGTPMDTGAAYELYLRFYLAHQRDIDMSVRNLRSNIRDTLSHASASLRQLAILDAALDEILWDRSRKLFSSIPRLLEKRFEQLYQEHQEHQTSLANPPGDWLERFCKEMQGLLLAELDVQLQPVLGLVEAFSKEVNKNQ